MVEESLLITSTDTRYRSYSLRRFFIDLLEESNDGGVSPHHQHRRRYLNLFSERARPPCLAFEVTEYLV